MPDPIASELTQDALRRLAGMKNRRMREIVRSLTRHLHDFVRDVKPTEAEWLGAIRFLTQTGQMCDERRQEFILLSDVLGASMLVDAINHRDQPGTTDSTVLGPFHVKGAKFMPKGADISQTPGGIPTLISGHVRAPDGSPIRGAVLDIWQTAANGFYSVQDPDQPAMNLRGRFRTDKNGHYAFRTVKPVSYPVPTDGPVGKLLKQMGRHPYRPAHVHFIVTAKGYEPLTTHLFVKGDPYLKSDAVFGVKSSLIVEFKRHTSRALADRLGVKPPFCTVTYDFGLRPARKATVRRKAKEATR